jgi:hypothetical protein
MKKKATIVELTKGEYYSIQDAETHLGIDKDRLLAMANENSFVLTVIYRKFTVFTSKQISMLEDLIRGRVSC